MTRLRAIFGNLLSFPFGHLKFSAKHRTFYARDSLFAPSGLIASHRTFSRVFFKRTFWLAQYSQRFSAFAQNENTMNIGTYTKYIKAISLCLLAACLLSPSLEAQNRRARRIQKKQKEEQAMQQLYQAKQGSGYLGYIVEDGDTVYYSTINPSWVFPKGYKTSNSEIRKYYKLVYNFSKAYPYALYAKDLAQQVDKHIAENELRRAKKDKYINQVQDMLFEAFESNLRSMTISQGKLLVRLVDRELGRTSYVIIKEYKSGMAAGFWQGVAKLFKQDLKSSYDPEGEDRITEYLIEKWEAGQFDALYYSIFRKMPKYPDLESKKIQFDD